MTRSENMARIRGRGTLPEKRVGAILRRLGLRYRKNVPTLPGRPDFANRRRGWAIFVHGCFWHRHPGCRRATTPSTNTDYWVPKLIGNAERDQLNQERLRSLGLKVLVIWECQTGDVATIEHVLASELPYPSR
jgi:DNA mismatch endonuclease (patch repair protein)